MYTNISMLFYKQRYIDIEPKSKMALFENGGRTMRRYS